MNPLAAHSEPLALLTAVQRAGQRIAPTWPLDRMIAVNPWWEWCDQPITDVAARLDALGRVHGLMPEAYYAERWQQGLIRAEHLQQAAAELGETGTTEVWLRALHAPSETAHWHNLSDLLDAARDRQHQMAWRDEITHQISQFCAAFCQQPGHQAAQHLYAHWLHQTRVDHGIAILMGEPGLTKTFATLPADSDALITTALTTLGMDDPALAEAYAQALLLDINGWASWLAHERWQARLAGLAEDALPQLVAIRLGWELALWRHWHHRHPQTAARLAAQWQRQRQHWPTLLERHREAQRPRWVWMRAAELARQEKEQQRLRQPRTATPATPTLQAVFCIDVRSEVMRRALEAQSSDIQTLGFAGFFGLPLTYAPVGTALARPQLPGLLAPRIQVSEGGHARVALGHQRRRRLEPRLLWDEVSRGAASAFSLVEATGLRYAATLLRQTFAPRAAAHPVNDLPGAESWILSQDGRPLLEDEKADLLAGILRAMNLTVLAQEVLLVGHGSHTTNNPHAAGLDCGACGGQTGEINVRVLAQMLNDEHLRAALKTRGQVIPPGTRFIAALHNTTTDHIRCFAPVSAATQQWLAKATCAAQHERAAALGLPGRAAEPLDGALRARAEDWSEVRPEWGLAGNSAFIVAPRWRTRGLDLEGRAFLHDYAWEQDTDFHILEQIMTAPMVVTHWINMQYNASVSEPLKYGSGNKVLHNVVGGHMGVFEGNGGDLRIGLPLQSVHDGTGWVHEPLRLSVYIRAPRAAIQTVLATHAPVRQLVDHQWLYLFRLDDDGHIEHYRAGDWHPTDTDA